LSVSYQLKGARVKNVDNALDATIISLQKLKERNEKIEEKSLENIDKMLKRLEISSSEATKAKLAEIKKLL
jgi:type I site-specific restriction endonuclease